MTVLHRNINKQHKWNYSAHFELYVLSLNLISMIITS